VAVALTLAATMLPAPPADAYVVHDADDYWRRHELTWSLRGQTADLGFDDQVQAIQAALDTWAAVTPLTFTQVADCVHPNCTEPDIRVWFTTDPHNQGPGDGDFSQLGGAGHGIYPGTTDAPGLFGDIHLDDSLLWAVDGTVNAKDVQSIVTHEAGHALGLAHATDCPGTASPTRPIMCPLILGIQHDLAPDDVAGIQSLYGPPEHLVDSTVRRESDVVALGDDIVNTTTRGQSVTTSRKRNRQARFVVQVSNDGSGDDIVTLQAPAAPAGFRYLYYAGDTGTTPATGITRGEYEVELDPGQSATVRVTVIVRATAVRHRSQGVRIRATSQRDATRVDVVRAIVKVT
jgi:hypothetical protein